MGRERRYDITLHLDNLAQFFRVPEPDPFDPQARFAPGLEKIMSELKPKARRGHDGYRPCTFGPTVGD